MRFPDMSVELAKTNIVSHFLQNTWPYVISDVHALSKRSQILGRIGVPSTHFENNLKLNRRITWEMLI